MRVFVTGGTGLIGRNLARKLTDRGDEVVVLTRSQTEAGKNPLLRGVQFVEGDPVAGGAWQKTIDGCDAVVNLVGHNLFANRWNPEIKRKIRDSRVYSTEQVVKAISSAERKPSVLVNGSAIGFYGPHGEDELTEDSPSGNDFMAVVCREWEDAAHPVESLGVRLVRVRTGVVLAKGEAALGVMTPIFRFVPGGAAPVGGGGSPIAPAFGKQWFSWIHLADIVGIITHSLDRTDVSGPINGVAPNAVRNAEFSKELAKALRGKGIWPLFSPIGPPDVMLRLILGEVAQVVTEGQRVLPKKATETGYSFQFPHLAQALENLFAQGSAKSKSTEPSRVTTRH